MPERKLDVHPLKAPLEQALAAAGFGESDDLVLVGACHCENIAGGSEGSEKASQVVCGPELEMSTRVEILVKEELWSAESLASTSSQHAVRIDLRLIVTWTLAAMRDSRNSDRMRETASGQHDKGCCDDSSVA